MAATNVNTEAKEAFITKIINLFPNDYICEDNKKYYFWSNGIQVCVSLTCPKNPVGESNTPPSAFPAAEVSNTMPIDYTEEERETIDKLFKSLGI